MTRQMHLAFFSFPNPPQINPTISIVRSLVRRGYRVTYVTSSRFSEQLSAVGATVIRCPPFTCLSTNQDRHEIDFERFVGALAIETLNEVMPILNSDRPRLLIYDAIALAGRLLAKMLNIPTIQVSTAFALDRKNFIAQMPNPASRRQECMFDEDARNFMNRYGVSSDGITFHEERLNIYMFPRALQLAGTSIGPQHFFAGRCAAERPYRYEEWISQENSLPLILVSNSTTYSSDADFFCTCISALSGLALRVILSVGNLDPTPLKPLPKGFDIVQAVSNLQILPHASLIICSGGMITQSEALYHGVPLIAVSGGSLELEWVAENIVRLGVGVHLRESETSPSRIRDAVIRVIDDVSIRRRVKELSKSIRREAGGEETANRIDEFIETEIDVKKS